MKCKGNKMGWSRRIPVHCLRNPVVGAANYVLRPDIFRQRCGLLDFVEHVLLESFLSFHQL